ncbi:MAG: heavy metal translocating P-type ATPase [Acidimicrobiia bacterium]
MGMRAAHTDEQRIDLPIEGMTCASCAARIERGLRKLDGVCDASVNYATAQATVRYQPQLVDTQSFRSTIERLGYRVPEVETDDPEANALKDVRIRLIVAVALSTPVIAISMIPGLQFSGWAWVCAVLSAPVVAWCGWPFHRAAFVNARHATATMDTLVSIGTLAAWGWSLYALVVLGAGSAGMEMVIPHPFATDAMNAHVYFETAAAIISLILLGRFFELRSRHRSGAALRALLALGATDAELENGDRVPAASLEVGDRFVVRPGMQIATDGVVVAGASAVNIAMLTGEPVPVDVSAGDDVFGATVNVSGRLVIEARRVGADTVLAQIARLVTQAQGSKAPIQRLADRIARVFVPIVLLISLATLVLWLLTTGSVEAAITAAVAVLIIACPCALGLATPTAIMVGTGRAAQLGIVIRGGEVLEATQRVDAIVLDKTGTLTQGALRVVGIATAPGVTTEEALRVIASADAGSEHPIARAIVAEAGARGLDLLPAADFVNTPGAGVRATIDGELVRIGRAAFVGELHPELARSLEVPENTAATIIYGAWGDACSAAVVLEDTIKPDAKAAVSALQKLGLRTILVTGDQPGPAQRVAHAVGVDEVIADARPEAKQAVVRALQEKGSVVAVVGDGVNDAPALAAADLGIAIGTGTDVAIQASDITLVSGDPAAIPDAILLARRTLAIIKGNLFWAFAYNVAAIPLAAIGILNPVIAAAAMGFSSVFVVSNSLRLRRCTGIRVPSGFSESPRSPQ